MTEDYVGRTCPFCQGVIKPGDATAICSACTTVHHRDCWQENGRCTTPGCRGNSRSAIQPHPLSPASATIPATLSSTKFPWVALIIGALYLLVFQGWPRFDAWRAKQEYRDALAESDNASLQRLAPQEYGQLETIRHRSDGFEGHDPKTRAMAYRGAMLALAKAKATADRNRFDADDIQRRLQPQCEETRHAAQKVSADIYAKTEWSAGEGKRGSALGLIEQGKFAEARIALSVACDAYRNAVRASDKTILDYTRRAEASGGLAALCQSLKAEARTTCESEVRQYFAKYQGAEDQYRKSNGIEATFVYPTFGLINRVLNTLSQADTAQARAEYVHACILYEEAKSAADRIRGAPSPEEGRKALMESTKDINLNRQPNIPKWSLDGAKKR